MLKKEVNIKKEKTIICVSFVNKLEREFVGKNPPEEIIVIAKFKELKVLKLNKFKITNKAIVNRIYKINILKDCFKVSDLLKDMKLVKDFLKLLSKISINRIIEYKK
tara:strand:+ start:85 stop:405 length:321 start_codon:yes stop_codon:yes gene_type:complete